MRRDMNIVYQIIRQIGDSESRTFEDDFKFDKEVSKEKLHYHLIIMEQEGVIEGSIKAYDDGEVLFYSLYLGWKGNDFYETFENDNVWENVKKYIKNKGMEVTNVPFDVLLEVGKNYIKSLF